MTREYIVEQTPDGKEVISYTEGGLTFTFLADPANSDYQAYLASLAEATNGDI